MLSWEEKPMELKTHWENVYQTKDSTQVSWYQPHLQLSLQMIEGTGVDNAARIIDIGGGSSTLVDDLLAAGYRQVTVLDISGAAIEVARKRLGAQAERVTWLEADITRAALPRHHYDVWHDRAVFHFLTNARDRQQYVNAVRQSVRVGGHVIVATFAPDGPEKCSGLNVMRYSAEGLHGEFGDDFRLVESVREDHQTPFGTQQKFVYCYCRK
jgi:2-polyprenyl-3-methyl-5-hydroxy-6-metoxy-1,4-benzoquinol methylase